MYEPEFVCGRSTSDMKSRFLEIYLRLIDLARFVDALLPCTCTRCTTAQAAGLKSGRFWVSGLVQ